MSRIGKKPIHILKGVTLEVSNGVATVKGPKGSLKVAVPNSIEVTVEEAMVHVSRQNELKQTKASHGLLRSLLQNAIIGVSEGFKKTLKMVGTGYRAQVKGNGISLAVGYSHPVEIKPLEGITLKLEGTETIYIEGLDKQVVGQMASDIRKVRPPEPYLGKGIRYADEVIRRKQGKAASK